MGNQKIPSWMPNWKNASAYPATFDEWTPKCWAWAFLRRNEDYQADFEHFRSLPDEVDGEETAKWSGNSASGDSDMKFRYSDPPAIAGETWNQYWNRVGAGIVKEMPIEEYLMEKWCVSHIFDPSFDLAHYQIIAMEESLPHTVLLNEHNPPPTPDGREHLTLRFDLRYSIDNQLARAKSLLQEALGYVNAGPLPIERIQVSGARTSEWPKYLRAFDASLAGAKASEIGALLYPEKVGPDSADAMKAAVNRAIRAGKALVKSGFKEILVNG